MYAKSQLQPLFEAAQLLGPGIIIANAPAVVAVNAKALAALQQEVQRLQSLNQELTLGVHNHRHGDSCYLFMHPADKSVGEEEFEANLQETFEPNLGETLTVTPMDAPTILA